MTGRSRVKTSGETSLNGDIAPLVPTTASELKKFEPIMLPSVSSFCPRRAEAMADASSGRRRDEQRKTAYKRKTGMAT